jgi:3-keto-L-gulonate-6-phosphate decarboxylase
LKDICELQLNVKVSVAGGINASTVRQVVDSGAKIVVVGAAIYGADSPAEAAREIRESISVTEV